MNKQTFNLCINPNSIGPVIHVNQYDHDTAALEFDIYGEPGFYLPVGTVAIINGTKPDKTGFSYSASVNGNVVTANVTEQMTALSGMVLCELVLTKGNDRVGTQNFILDVERAALADDTVISETDISAIENAEQYAANAAQSANDAQAAVDTINALGKGIGTMITEPCDISAIITPGFYYVHQDYVSGLPEGGNGSLWVYEYASGSAGVIQIYRRVGTAGANDQNLYIRRINKTGTDTRSWWKYLDENQVVKKTGDTMTGALVQEGTSSLRMQTRTTNVDVTTPPSSTLYPGGLVLTDKNGVEYGRYRGVNYKTSGAIGLNIEATRNVSGTNKYNTLNLTVEPDGSPTIAFSSGGDVAWRKTLKVTPYSDSISMTFGSCAGHITSSQTYIAFFIPYPLFSEAATKFTITRLRLAVRHSDGGYIYVRSGETEDKYVYTVLNSTSTTFIEGGAAARTNEIASFAATVYPRAGLGIGVTFTSKICKDNKGTEITNNIPITVIPLLIGTFS